MIHYNYDKLFQQLKKRNISIYKLEEKMGITRGLLGRLRKNCNTTIDTLAQIAYVSGIERIEEMVTFIDIRKGKECEISISFDVFFDDTLKKLNINENDLIKIYGISKSILETMKANDQKIELSEIITIANKLHIRIDEIMTVNYIYIGSHKKTLISNLFSYSMSYT